MPRTYPYAYTVSRVNEIDADVARVLAERSAARLKLFGSSLGGRPRPVRPEWQLSPFEIADMLLRPYLRPRPFVVVKRRHRHVVRSATA